MSEPDTTVSLTPIFDQLLREQEQQPCADPPADTGPDQPAESSDSPPPS